ncbi:MAG: carbamoyltransferase HypF [Anaerolineae bacterium]
MNTVRTSERIARHVTITGVVQGVGFRPFVYNLADEMDVAGWVLNHSGGVDIEVEGPPPRVSAFIAALTEQAPPLASIESLEAEEIAVRGYEDFEIRHSQSQEGRYQLISPDVATCDDCVRELFDPEDPRYRYPFINCTNCGPRFTIIEDIPYDRPKTTMRAFPMCDFCRSEYEDPRKRRFHAQPVACPVCGPQIWLVESEEDGPSETALKRLLRTGDLSSGVEESETALKRLLQTGDLLSGVEESETALKRLLRTGDLSSGVEESETALKRLLQTGDASSGVAQSDAVLARARELLLAGKILAIKGLGGFHLACDATNAEAVARLRARKRRPHKPFAIMVPTLEGVRALCEVSPEEETLLSSPQAPIVLLRARPDIPVVEGVAPNSHVLGVMIPYTPLHHLLLREVNRPLVMTSGNVTEEPIAKDNEEALRRLGPLADAFLLHDRGIYARYDDSVVQVLADEEAFPRRGSATSANQGPSGRRHVAGTQFLRRARGYAPFPIRLPFKAPQIFAAGPMMKNTFTLTRDEYAFVSQHIGDLENLETLEHYEKALATYRHLFRLEPEFVACDLHPDYLSTRWAETFAQDHGLAGPYRVQHHHAHIAACLADNGWSPEAGPVIGVALDGSGYGEDGRIWGGEWFVGDYTGFTRAAHLAYQPLPGGDAAIRHPWRIAVAYLHALSADERLPLGEFCPGDVMRVRTMVDRELNTPLTSSMGRLFDAVSALLGVCPTTTYEAQAAIELEQVATTWGGRAEPYPFDVDASAKPYRVRLASLFEALLDDVEGDLPVAQISRRFHTTVAAMVVDVAERLRQDTGIDTVALSGGVFQNRLLLTLVLPRLWAADFEVLLHRGMPPNDGCVSLGQAALAAFSV